MLTSRRRREHRTFDDVVLVDDDRRQPHDPDDAITAVTERLGIRVLEAIVDFVSHPHTEIRADVGRQRDLVGRREPGQATRHDHRAVLSEEPSIEAAKESCVAKVSYDATVHHGVRVSPT